MKLSSNQTGVESLTQLGQEAVALVAARDFSTLAQRFGYSLSYGRDPAQAIESDFAQCIAEAESPSSDTQQSIQVKYFKPNSIPLYALVECVTPISQNAAVLVELIVAGEGEEKHIALEQISYVT